MAAPLAGTTVLVTRPAGREAGLVSALEAAGARVVHFPVIAIEPLAGGAPADAGRYDIVLFVSPAAVIHGSEAVGPAAGPRIGAVGPGTAAGLRARGFDVAIGGAGSADSEGLLEDPALAAGRIAGRRILIVRGEGGRAHLGERLVARGATVDYAEVYRRVRPRGLDPGAPAGCDIVTLTSNEGADNLLAMVEDAVRRALLGRPVAAASERTAERARALGFAAAIEVAGGADDDAMRRAVLRLRDPGGQPDPGAA